ncbi:Cation transport ATPase [Methylomagnum ishizawai]|uniref:Cation transport ATPase n=1 Tax=Methylomagnum ishizawai TaxID=1760988 RepID=A0A1Y6D358_9GAMM|nr:hypothetical protein [Methylomagnum ishizawai]SMF94824.1 Cation transport ATPase [Methylomagnum ishizawai]
MNGSVLKPKISLGADSIRIEDGRIFAGTDPQLLRCFARRVLGLAELRSLALLPGEDAALIRFEVDAAHKKAFLARLSAAVGGQGQAIADSALPAWRVSEAVTFHRHGDLISTWEILGDSRGKLQLRHPGILQDPAFGLAAEQALRGLPGVKDASAIRSSGKLWVSYDGRIVTPAALLRAVERPAAHGSSPMAVPQAKPVDLTVANASVGLATVGELVLPLATPVCAGLLVVTNFGMLREAGQQLRRGKFGTPVWTTALLACSIVSGQVLAYALTDWSFRYWSRRWRKDVATHSQALARETIPAPEQARFLSTEGIEVMTPVEQLTPGHAIGAAEGDLIPVDGRVIEGSALVHETHLSGAATSVRKIPGDAVYAGSTVIAGRIQIEVERTGQETRAAQIAQSMARTVAAIPGDPALNQRSIALVDRTVPPTLAAAGVGLVVGDLFTVGAILHQDWLSGAELAVPLETSRDIKLAAGRGALILNPSALQRFHESKFVVLEDQPALRLRALDLGAMRSRIPETDALLQHVAGAGLYLGDERSAALARACAERGLVVRQPELQAMDADSVTVRDGKHRIVLRGAKPVGDTTAHLEVEIDGTAVAELEFRRAARMQAAEAVTRLRRHGFQVFLVSDQPEAETAALAQQLGVELHSGDLSVERKTLFLEGLRRRDVRPVWIGNSRTSPALREHAHVTVALAGGADLADDVAVDIVLLGESLEPLADIAALSAENRERIVKTCRTAMIPNLLCIVGAFAGLLNGITAGILANIAVYNVYRSAKASLRASAASRNQPARLTV